MAVPQLVLAAALTLGSASIAQTPQPRWTMTGRVLAAEDGAPVAGCTVTADGYQATGYDLGWSWLDWRNPEPVTTGADGRFNFTFPAQPGRGISDGYPSRVHLIIKAKDRVGVFGNRYLSTFFDEPDQDLGDFRLPRGLRPQITIIDTDGAPQRVRVRIAPVEKPAATRLWYWLERSQHPRSGADGVVQMDQPLMPGRYELTVSNREVATELQHLEIPDSPDVALTPLRIVVKPVPAAATAAGRVVDADGKPVADYLLYAEATTPDGKGTTIAARSGADGRFELIHGGLAVGATFNLRHPRNNRYDGWHEFGQQPWGKRDLLLTLGGPAAVELRVTTVNREPIDRLAVHLVPASAELLGADPVRVTGTFTDGKVHVDGLRRGRYFVRVHAQGTARWPSDWIECDAVPTPLPVHIALRAPIARTLHVFTDEGRPAAGCTVELLDGNRDTLAAAQVRRGIFRDHGVVDRTMTGSVSEKGKVTVADRATADVSGKLVLAGLATDSAVVLRVRGGGAQDTLHELPAWTDDRATILVTVPAGGAVSGKLTPADFARRRDVSTEVERTQHLEWGRGTNPWRRSLADLRAASRPGIALRAVGEEELWRNLVAPLGDDGSFAFDGLPPADYDVVLVLRVRVNDRTVDEVVAPPLLRTKIATGATRQLAVAVPEGIK